MKKQILFNLKRATCVMLCMVFCMGVCSCSSVRVSGRAIRPYEYPPMRYDGSFWKQDLWEKSNVIMVEDKRHTVAAVRCRTNYWYALATVLTFGLWAPIDIEWEENDD
ncbi:MAG: hypothetical protein IJU61_08530 [Victivallales bacterium]|jgi:hypothetical protein|nr:hypothetical protein [Victivallales bacterium]